MSIIICILFATIAVLVSVTIRVLLYEYNNPISLELSMIFINWSIGIILYRLFHYIN